MSELTVTLLQFGFLALLWLFIAAVVFSQARDLSVSGKARSRSRGRTRSAVATEEPVSYTHLTLPTSDLV